jgi:hypothetical protein
MNKLLISAAVLMLTAGSAAAQSPAAAPAAKQAAPTAQPTPSPVAQAPTSQPTVQRPPLPTSATTGSISRGSAATPVEAKQLHEAKLRERQQTCAAKGAAYRWKPPHVAGDANPKGGFYVSNYAGGCTMISMKEALGLGIVTVNPSARPN